MEIFMKRSTLAALLLALISTSAFADNDSGLYAGVGGGQYNVKTKTINNQTFDGDDTVYKVFAGYRFSKFISVELDYVDLGSVGGSASSINFESKTSGFAPYVIATIPIGPIEAFGRVGYYFYDVKNSGNVAGFAASGDDHSEDPVYGVGVGMAFFDHLTTRLEYEFFDIENTESANAVWLSAAFRF
jgi:opacity protein-like surface antigen